jgi:hypothetical protein
VDIMGLLPTVLVTAASGQDRDDAGSPWNPAHCIRQDQRLA